MRNSQLRNLCLFVLMLLFPGGALLMAQESGPVVSGTVLSEKGDYLNGVNVEVTGVQTKEKLNVVTNEKGFFKITTLKAGGVYNISFSYVGYEPYRIKSFRVKEGNQNSFLIRMKESRSDMDKVVVVGYGSQARAKSYRLYQFFVFQRFQ